MMLESISTAYRVYTSCARMQNDSRNRRNAGGFSLVSAIFLLVILAALGVAMVSISTVQNQSSALDIQGVRAYQAARAGVEWGLYNYIRSSSCVGSSTVAMPAELNVFTVTVKCDLDVNPLGVVPAPAVIKATACNIPVSGTRPNTVPNSSNYVQRVVEVRL